MLTENELRVTLMSLKPEDCESTKNLVLDIYQNAWSILKSEDEEEQKVKAAPPLNAKSVILVTTQHKKMIRQRVD